MNKSKLFGVSIVILFIFSGISVSGNIVSESNNLNKYNSNQIRPCGRSPLPDWIEPTEIDPTLILNNIPPSWDWRDATHEGITGNWMSPVKDQRWCGSCWDFAAHGALEAVINIKSKTPDLDLGLSEQFILSCAPIGGCNGSSAILAYMYMMTIGGTILESCFPYEWDDGVPCSTKCSDWEKKLVPIANCGVWIKPNKDFLKSALIELGPMVTGMVVPSEFYSYHGGIIDYDGDESFLDISHEVVLLGYNDNPGYWICKNSWGDDWGEDGYFNIAYDTCQVGWEVTYVEYDSRLYKPNKPKGETSGSVGKEYTYKVSAEHPNGKKIKFGWDWSSDWKVDEWTDYYESGEICYIDHEWGDMGVYLVQVIAKCEDGLRSDWSDTLTVTMPRTNFRTIFFEKFFDFFQKILFVDFC